MANQTYTVKPNDTLSKLAEQFKTTVMNLRQLNPTIKDVNQIRVGQMLTVPVVTTTATKNTGGTKAATGDKPKVEDWVMCTGYLYASASGDGKEKRIVNEKHKVTKINYGPSWAIKPVYVDNLGWMALTDVKVLKASIVSAPKPSPLPIPGGPKIPPRTVEMAGSKKTIADFKKDVDDYTANVWDNMKKDTTMAKKFEPYFYDSSKPKLQKGGFDINIVYGGAIQSLIELNKYNQSHNSNAFTQFKNNTVKSIKGVFIRSVGQELDASGNPIYELYEFIARDVE